MEELPAEIAIDLAASRAEVGRACEEARRFCAARAVSEEQADDLCLALDEILSNVVVHGYREDPTGRIELRLRRGPGVLAAEIRDRAPAFDPLLVAPPDLDAPADPGRIGGLGIHLVRAVMDEVAYERIGDVNVVRVSVATPAKP
jgi:anti-sigma regulatory factor (Ser/Thr protein kinase)